MSFKKTCATSITPKSPSNGRQLELFTTGDLHNKPQIFSIPGISPKQRDRYRVMAGNEILGDRLTLDEVLTLSKSLNSASNNPSHS